MKNLSFLILIIFLTGCVPAQTSYYKPTAKVGKAINDQCGTAIAPKSTYKLTLDGIDFRIKGYDGALAIYLRIPEGKRVKIDSDIVNLTTINENYEKSINSFKYYDRELKKYISIASKNILIGANEKYLLGNIEPRMFSSAVKFGVSIGNTFSAKFPSIEINRVKYSIPTINFEKESSFGIYPINC